MNKLYVLPIVISCIVVVAAYMMKKEETDNNKKPNYTILFIGCLGLSGLITYMIGSPGDNGINIAMKEIDGGEAPF